MTTSNPSKLEEGIENFEE
ncbi:Cytochrome P450, partial [Danaus plexippus plexippus]